MSEGCGERVVDVGNCELGVGWDVVEGSEEESGPGEHYAGVWRAGVVETGRGE